MGLFTLHNCCVPCSLDYLKSYLESKSRLPISELSSYLCISCCFSMRRTEGGMSYWSRTRIGKKLISRNF